jgi:hypothetical protein
LEGLESIEKGVHKSCEFFVVVGAGGGVRGDKNRWNGNGIDAAVIVGDKVRVIGSCKACRKVVGSERVVVGDGDEVKAMVTVEVLHRIVRFAGEDNYGVECTLLEFF